jgi:hypothetical protein
MSEDIVVSSIRWNPKPNPLFGQIKMIVPSPTVGDGETYPFALKIENQNNSLVRRDGEQNGLSL